jgi:hypothetical protein
MPVMPSDTPSSPQNYDSVTPHGQGTAPYDVQAPMQDLAAMTAAAVAAAGPGGPRQAQTEALLVSPQGYGLPSGSDITAGFNGSGDDSWPAMAEPDVAGP